MASRSVKYDVLRWLSAPEQNFLRWGFALSLLVHALVLGWPAPSSPSGPGTIPNLEVVIVNAFDDREPLAPQIIAQSNLEGGGDQSARIASNPVPRMGDVAQEISIEAMTQQRQTLETQQAQLLRQILSVWQIPDRAIENLHPDNQEVQGPDPTDQRALELNSRIAAILQDIERYNARPRKHFDAPSAIANRYAPYIDAWKEAVERTGSQHYPGDDKQRPTGDLQATVTIDSAGRVIDVLINRPAEDPRLNQAVRRILQLAGPFAPFPPSISSETDQLVITRTWEFTAGQLTTRAP